MFSLGKRLTLMAVPVAAVAVVVAIAGASAVAGGGDPQAAQGSPPGGLQPTLGSSAHAAPMTVYTGGAIVYKRVVTSTSPTTITSTASCGVTCAFVDLPGAGPPAAAVPLAPGETALINVRFTAESRCSGGGSVMNWCEAQVFVGSPLVEADPAASLFPSDTYAFDSTDNGTETVGSWEGHALERHTCLTNHSPAKIIVPVQVRWRIVSFSLTPTSFWLDDWSLAIEKAEASPGCEKVHH